MDKKKVEKMHEHLMVNDSIFYEMVVDHQLRTGSEVVDLPWSICKTIDLYIQRDKPSVDTYFFTKPQVIELLKKHSREIRFGIPEDVWLDKAVLDINGK